MVNIPDFLFGAPSSSLGEIYFLSIQFIFHLYIFNYLII